MSVILSISLVPASCEGFPVPQGVCTHALASLKQRPFVLDVQTSERLGIHSNARALERVRCWNLRCIFRLLSVSLTHVCPRGLVEPIETGLKECLSQPSVPCGHLNRDMITRSGPTLVDKRLRKFYPLRLPRYNPFFPRESLFNRQTSFRYNCNLHPKFSLYSKNVWSRTPDRHSVPWECSEFRWIGMVSGMERHCFSCKI